MSQNPSAVSARVVGLRCARPRAVPALHSKALPNHSNAPLFMNPKLTQWLEAHGLQVVPVSIAVDGQARTLAVLAFKGEVREMTVVRAGKEERVRVLVEAAPESRGTGIAGDGSGSSAGKPPRAARARRETTPPPPRGKTPRKARAGKSSSRGGVRP